MSWIITFLNFFVVFTAITICSLYYLLCLRQAKSRSYYESLYERSNPLMILANLSNYVESFFNILFGLLSLLHDYGEEYWLSSFIFANFFTRVYAFTIGLRIARISSLNDARTNGKIIRNNILINWKSSFLISCLYGISTTAISLIINILLGAQIVQQYIIRITYAIESVVMLLASYHVFTKARHPSISLEYIFYSIIWISGTVPFDVNKVIFTIPIRNIILLLISYESLQKHNDLIRPQLPFIIEFDNLFEIRELYDSFTLFVEKVGNSKEKSAFYLFFRIKVNQICKGKNNCSSIIDDFLKNQEFISLHSSITLIDLGIVEETLKEILSEISTSYLESSELSDLKKNYFINFN